LTCRNPQLQDRHNKQQSFSKQNPSEITSISEGCFGGAKRDRTADLYNAIVALSQLSYGPQTLGLNNGFETAFSRQNHR
jgi:hypothetical protein